MEDEARNEEGKENETAERKEEGKRDYWEGFPEDLSEMIIEIYHTSSGWLTCETLYRLREELDKADPKDGADAFKRITWVDRLFRDILCDGDWHDSLWESNQEIAREVLKKAAHLMVCVPVVRYADLEGMEFPELEESSLFYAQRLNAYLCVDAAFEEDGAQVEWRLAKAVEDVLVGIRHVLRSDNVEALAKREDTEDYGMYLPGQRFWTEPLAIIRSATAYDDVAQLVLDAHRRYLNALILLFDDAREPAAVDFRVKLIDDAQRAIEKLEEMIIDDF